MTSPTAPPVEDPKFVSNVVECFNVMTKEKTWKAIKNARELIQQLPELMDKAIPIGKKGGLVVLSAYVLYKRFELYDRAMTLARDYEFELLQEEIIPFRDYLESQLIPQWKKGNFANMQMITGKLLERLSRDSTVLGQLVQVIHQHAKKGESDKRWTAFSGVTVPLTIPLQSWTRYGRTQQDA
ncbi:hypothetical protein OS493_004207 [Desmophyllum pertusum]|uniref:Uncharacterized protein n=1 Tax=Desmophyllum pertusum TaxID=174260 RepID=A0A9W9ZU93_9CNID|nr:hypothetical protein OS493_004207 [Desmophyllum pertusum]